MDKIIEPPAPTEEKLLSMVTRDVIFPNGRSMTMAMSQWHWEMVAFVDIWNDHYSREQGILWEFLQQKNNVTDTFFAEAVMAILRDDYNEWLAATPSGKPIRFVDPRP